MQGMRARDVFGCVFFSLIFFTYVCNFYIRLFVCLWLFFGKMRKIDFSYIPCEELVAETCAIVDSELWGFPLWERCVGQT